MRKRRRFRGVSLGTVTMLLMTVMVVAGMMAVLPKLTSNVDVKIDTSKVLDALSLGDGLPELGLSDIPIQIVSSQPTANPQATIAPPDRGQVAQPTAVPTAVLTPTPVPGGSFTMTAGGSIIMDATLRKAGYFSESEKYDFTDIFSLLHSEMQGDVRLVSLENMIYPDAKLSDLNTTADVLPMLTALGVNTVAMGFQKAYDQGLAGLTSTVQQVRNNKLSVIGAFTSAEEAAIEQQIQTIGGVKVALLHYADGLSSKGSKAVKKDGGTYAVPNDAVSNGADTILTDVAAARSAGAQVIIVSLNWGANGKSAPTKKQQTYAQQLADAGVDVILGTGSRVVQPVVWLEGKAVDGSAKKTLCAYSLGSLYNSSRKNGNVAALLLHLDIAYDPVNGVTFNQTTYTPTYIWRYKQDGRYYYRVVASDKTSPDGMSDDQTESRMRAYNTVKKNLGEDAPIAVR